MARVLVVEDEACLRRLLCESISGLGHDPEEARDGLEALECFRRGAYDAVVTDLTMPRMDGIELTRRLRSLDPGIAVLMVTGQGSLDLMVRAVNRGIQDYLRKPFPLADFEQTVERALQARGRGGAVRSGRRPGRALRWSLVVLAGVLAGWLAWRLWQQESGMRELARRIDRVEVAAPGR